MRRWLGPMVRNEALLTIGFALALAVLLGIAGLSYRSIDQFGSSADWLDHTHRVIGDLDDLLSVVKSAETEQRGFLLSGDERYLEPHSRAVAIIPNLLDSLRQRTRDNPRQQEAIGTLAQLIPRKLALLQANIAQRQSGLPPDLAALQQGRGAMADIEFQIQRMKAGEERLLVERSAELDHQGVRNQAIILLGNLTAVTLLLLVGALLWRETARRKKTETERERFFTLSLDLLGIAGIDGYFKRLNPAFEQTLGYATDELQARPFLEFVHPDDHASTLAEVAKLSHGEPSLEFENRYRCKDGSWKWLSWRVRPFPSEGLLYCTARDVTGQKHAAETITSLNTYLDARVAQLDSTNKDLDSFSYTVSHDLRSPLRAINGYAQMLEEDYSGRLDDEGRRLLRVVRDSATRMGLLIDDLLAFSRLGRAPVARASVDMQALAKEVAAQLQRDEGNGRAQMAIGVLPSVLGDHAMLRQVWVNLLGNALKYSSRREAPQIEVSGSIEGTDCVFRVADNGVGFDMRYYEKLFGVFQRLHGSGEFAGTGVGLAIVQRIVSRHGGRVWAKGQPDAGATFHFSLPAKESDHA
jgi:PAS domain S-box-containing protein